MVRCLGQELGADVNQAINDSATPFVVAAQEAHLDVVRSVGEGLGAEVNKAGPLEITAVLAAQDRGYIAVVHCVLKMKADPQLRSTEALGVRSPHCPFPFTGQSGGVNHRAD